MGNQYTGAYISIFNFPEIRNYTVLNMIWITTDKKELILPLIYNTLLNSQPLQPLLARQRIKIIYRNEILN
jgi:hypothetical protein